MTTGGTTRFGTGVAWLIRGAFAFVALAQVGTALMRWRYDTGPDGLGWLSFGTAAIALLAVATAGKNVVSVGDGRVRWWTLRGRHDLAFDEVADVRPHPRSKAVQVVTTDGRELRLPLRPEHGPQLWQLVLGGRGAATA